MSRHHRTAPLAAAPAAKPVLRQPRIEALEGRTLFAITAAAPYLVPSQPTVEILPLQTVGDVVPETGSTTGSTYRMVGLPDGLGAFDNGNGTFTVLMNHELRPTAGVVRDHGSVGAFVSKYIINKSTKQVISGDDLIKTVQQFDRTTRQYVALTTAFNRFCSASLAAATAYFNPASGKGTTARIFNNGEETEDGRAWAHIVTGASAGTSFELPWLGRYAFENVQASPFPQDKTIVAGLDDSSRLFTSEGAGSTANPEPPSEVYFYVGEKKNTGSVVDRAGLTGGILHGLRVGVPGAYDANESTVANGERFELVGLGDASTKTAAELEADSVANTVTQFRRVEDGHWDPDNPNDFYFTTTDIFGGTTRVWRLRFDDVRNPQAGGTIEVYIDSPPGVPGEMFDNLTVDPQGNLLVQEDPGNQEYVARIWKKDEASTPIVEVARHNPDLFDPNLPGAGQKGPNFITQDEESSGIIDVQDIMGRGWYLADVQAHAKIDATNNPRGFANPDELVEDGQFMLINTNVPRATLDNGTLTVRGTINDDVIYLTRSGSNGSNLDVIVNSRRISRLTNASVQSVVVVAGTGSDDVFFNWNVQQKALIRGGLGDDLIHAGGGRAVVIGDEGADTLRGGAKDDILIGGTTTLSDAQLATALSQWAGAGSYSARVGGLRPLLAGGVTNDFAVDRSQGLAGTDWFFQAGSPADSLLDRHAGEAVN